MSKLDELYIMWSEENGDSADLKKAYNDLSERMEKIVGADLYNELDNLIMECVILERMEAFKGGFHQATAIWKECL